MKIVLINPPSATEFDKHWARFPVLGLSYIASSLKKENHEVIMLDGKLGQLTFDQIISRTITEKPALIGITCMTVEYPGAQKIASTLKQHLNTPIVVGGAHVNAVESLALEECSSFDFACVGEGEYLILDLIDVLEGRKAIDQVPGLLYRNENNIIPETQVQFTGTRPYPKDYNELPFPAWDLFNVGKEIPILTHRGCPFHCTFCGHNSGFKARFRTPENVVEEISYVVNKFKPEVIRFEDETFGLDLKRTKRIIELIMAADIHKHVRFSAQTRVDKIDLEFVTMMKEANFETLELGVETGNPEILEAIKKRITLPQVENAVKLAKQCNLKVWCKFILGHPNETLDTIKDTLHFIRKINPDQLSVSIMTPYPGTPIYDMAIKGEGGYKIIGEGWEKYDKYSLGVLELEGVTLAQLKLYQILCYLNLYLGNHRYFEIVKLVRNHFSMATSLLYGTLRQVAIESIRSR